MTPEYDYVIYGQIQNTKIEHFRHSHTGLSFKDAIRQLFDSGEYKHGVPKIPDFLSWNLHSSQELKELICQIPISVEEVLNYKEYTVQQVRHIPTHNRVQISMESCYTVPQLISINYFSLFYVLGGRCTLCQPYSERIMQCGELCILPPDIPYSVLTEPDDLVINIISDKMHFKENFSQLLYHDNIVSEFFRKSLFQDSRECIYFMLPPTKDIRSIIQHLFAEFVKKDSYSEALFNNYLQIFYANIIRSTESTYDFYADQEDTTARILMPAILEYITRNYHALTLERLAAYFHYEQAYLSKLIKAATGKNYSKIITELKIKEAKELLRNTDLKIEEIAAQTGYNSADHFTYTFKKETGMSPREYRKRGL